MPESTAAVLRTSLNGRRVFGYDPTTGPAELEQFDETAFRPARTLYLAAGAAPDCDVRDGTKLGGGTPTDNSAVLNPLLAAAGPTNHLRVVVNGGFAHSGITLPDVGCLELVGHGSGTGGTLGTGSGFYTLAGSNTDAFSNAWARANITALWAGTATLARRGGSVAFRDLFFNFNRGTSFVNVGTAGAGVSTPAGSPGGDLRGLPLRWYCGFLFAGYADVRFEGCTFLDAPAYLINLIAWGMVHAVGCHFVQTAQAVNQDGLHLNTAGGVGGDCYVSDCYAKTGDDFVAVNLEEDGGGTGQAGRILIHDNTLDGVGTISRVYGNTLADTRMVSIRGNAGTVLGPAVILGLDQGGAKTADINHDLLVEGNKLTLPNTNGLDSCLVWGCSSGGSLTIRGNELLETPSGASPALLQTSLGGANVRLSSVTLEANKTYQSAAGPGTPNWLQHGAGRIDRLSVVGNQHHGQEGIVLTPPAAMLNFTGGSAGKLHAAANDWDRSRSPLWALSGGSAVDLYSGGDVERSGLLLPDYSVAPFVRYRASGHANKYAIKDNAGLVTLPDGTTAQSGSAAAFAYDYASDAKFSGLTAADAPGFRAGSGAWWVGCWVKLLAKPATLQPLVSKWTVSGGGEYILCWSNGPDRWAIFASDGANAEGKDCDGAGAPSLGVWYYVEAWRDPAAGANGTVYIAVNASASPDSVAMTHPQLASSAQPFWLGYNPTGGAPHWALNGQLDRGHFLTGTVPSLSQRQAVYNAGHGIGIAGWNAGALAGLTPNALYDFEDEFLGLDTGPNGLHLTPFGTPPPGRTAGVA